MYAQRGKEYMILQVNPLTVVICLTEQSQTELGEFVPSFIVLSL